VIQVRVDILRWKERNSGRGRRKKNGKEERRMESDKRSKDKPFALEK